MTVLVEPASAQQAPGQTRDGASEQATPSASAGKTTSEVQPSDIVNRIVEQENNLVRSLANYQPRVETYIQDFRPDPVLGFPTTLATSPSDILRMNLTPGSRSMTGHWCRTTSCWPL